MAPGDPLKLSRRKVIAEVAMVMVCALIVVAAVLVVPVMIGAVVAHVHHMVTP